MTDMPIIINEQRLVAEFLELVRIDSPSRAEREIANVLTAKLAELGLEVYEDQAGVSINSTTGNLIARLPASLDNQQAEQKPAVFFSAHMDTVQPGVGIEPLLVDGVITSAGETVLGGDDKAGIATILEALRVVIENGISHGEIEVIFTVCEEVGLLGAAQLDYDKVNSKMGFILDAAGPVGTIIIKGPAQVRIEAGITGKAAHAGVCPEAGISAIQVAAKAISQMKLGRIDTETTANIGIIEGGKAINIVPDLVNLKGEARSQQPAKLEAQVKHMRVTFEQAATEAGASVQMLVDQLYPHIELSPEATVVQTTVRAAARLGLPVSLEATGGGSDANMFNGKGLAAVNLGIGMNQVHTSQESMAVADLVKTAQFLVEIIKTV